MNPLGQLPASTSPRFSLDSTDLQKAFRMLLMQAAGFFLTIGVPYLTGHKWQYDGMDYTAIVLAVTPVLAELVRRWLAGVSPPKPQQPPAK